MSPRRLRPSDTQRAVEGVCFSLERCDRRSLCLMVTPEGAVRVRAPRHTPVEDIEAFVRAKAAWIQDRIARQAARRAVPEPTPGQVRALCDRARAVLPEKIARYGAMLGAAPARITITGARTRFGSCSAKGAVCFSWRLFQYPDEAVDYVVVHELAHLLHLNHSPAFHAAVASILPDWKRRGALLRQPPGGG